MFPIAERIFPITEYIYYTAEYTFLTGERNIQLIFRQTVDYYAKVFTTRDERCEEYREEDSIS